MGDWPPEYDWIKTTGVCDTDNMPVERDLEILREFINHNSIGDEIEVDKRIDGVSASNSDLRVRNKKNPSLKYENFSCIPDVINANITGIYCGKGVWRVEAKLIDFETTEIIEYNYHGEGRHKWRFEDINISISSRALKEGGAVRVGSQASVHQGNMQTGRGKRVRKSKRKKSKKRKRSSRRKSKKRKRSSRRKSKKKKRKYTKRRR